MQGFGNVGSATGASPSPQGGRGSTRNFSAEKYPCSQNLVCAGFAIQSFFVSQTHYPSKILPILYPNRRPAIPPTPESKTELIEKNPLPHSKGIAPPAVEPTKIPSHIQSFFIHFQYSHLMEPHQGIPRRPRCSFSILQDISMRTQSWNIRRQRKHRRAVRLKKKKGEAHCFTREIIVFRVTHISHYLLFLQPHSFERNHKTVWRRVSLFIHFTKHNETLNLRKPWNFFQYFSDKHLPC